jgi:hypothetical protein
LTLKENINEILKCGYLRPTDNLGKCDDGLVFFETYTGSDTLKVLFAAQKSLKFHREISVNDIEELFFDGHLLQQNGLLNNLGEHCPITKAELQVFISYPERGIIPKPSISKEQYLSVGDYRTVSGKVPLIYLTGKSKQEMEIR